MLDPTVWSHIQDDLARLRNTLNQYHDRFSTLSLIDNAINFVEYMIIDACKEKEEGEKRLRLLKLIK